MTSTLDHRAMTERRYEFEHDGHRFAALQRTVPRDHPAGEPLLHWTVTMDGVEALEFSGEYPYRDPDVRRRIVEWYETQKPR